KRCFLELNQIRAGGVWKIRKRPCVYKISAMRALLPLFLNPKFCQRHYSKTFHTAKFLRDNDASDVFAANAIEPTDLFPDIRYKFAAHCLKLCERVIITVPTR